MSYLWEIIKNSIPALVSGIVAYNIAIHNINNNRPLNNYKISYNRIYYPIYRIISSKKYKEVEHQNLQETMSIIIRKYEKYMSVSTIKTYNNYFEDYVNDRVERFKSFDIFKDNICDNNYKLRKKLGYLQDDFISSFKYLNSKSKDWMIAGLLYCLLVVLMILFDSFNLDIILLIAFVAMCIVIVLFKIFLINIRAQIYYSYIKLKRIIFYVNKKFTSKR